MVKLLLRSKIKTIVKDIKKKFIATIKFNEISNKHQYIKNFVNNSSIDLDEYYVPMDIPDRKLEQYIFTVKKMRKSLNF